MQTIPEQISSAGRAQLQAQLELFSSIAVATVENTGKLALFQLDASREALGRSWTAWGEMLAAGPQNMFELMSKAQSSFAGMLDPARSPFAAAAQPEAVREEDHKAPEEQQPLAATAHAAQPPLHRTPIAEAASEVVPDGQAGVPIAAAPIDAERHATLPKVKPVEAVQPPARSDGPGQRKGGPRK